MTKRCILIGHPVGHSVSPAIHGEAYRHCAIDATYELRDAPTEADVLSLVAQVRAGEIHGANVTVPYKQLALRAADYPDASAAEIGAANVLCRDQAGRVVAYNTDALGLCDELLRLKSLAGARLGRRGAALVLGNGGAAFAAVVACRSAGFAPVRVTARRFDPSVPEAEWPGFSALIRLSAELVAWPGYGSDALRAVHEDTALIVQATSAGMKGAGGGDELVSLLGLDAFPPLLAAQGAGHVADTGLGMLVGQAAHAIEIWFGVTPARAPLLEAARGALGL